MSGDDTTPLELLAIVVLTMMGGCEKQTTAHPVTNHEPARAQFSAPTLGTLTRVQGSVGTLPPHYLQVCRKQTRRVRPKLQKVSTSTGFFSREGWYLTAAHNIHDYAFSKLAAWELECGAGIPGASPDIARFGPFEDAEHSAHTPETFGCCTKKRDDYAYLAVPCHSSADGFAILDGPLQLQPGETVFIAGFPADTACEDLEGKAYDGTYMYHAEARVTDVDHVNHRFSYELRTTGGLSGAPVWQMIDGEPTVIGIHVSGNGCDAESPIATARMIDDDVREDLQAWVSGRSCSTN
jgi:V8-like Glu-specific endopeptidase